MSGPNQSEALDLLRALRENAPLDVRLKRTARVAFYAGVTTVAPNTDLVELERMFLDWWR